MATTSSNSHDHPVKVGGKSYRTGSIGHQHTVPDQFTAAEVMALRALLAAGGGGGGTVPAPNTPPPADPPTEEPSGTGVTLPVGTSQSAFLTAMANLSYDYILLAGGDYSWNNVDWSAIDRTSNPLLIQPVAGQRVRFNYPSETYGIFRTGLSGSAKHITFDGRVADGFLFDGITVGQAGILALFGSDHLTFRNITVRNMKRGPASDQPYKSWVAYIAAPYGRNNDHLTLDRFTLLAPAVNRAVSGFQVASSGSHGEITISNVTMTGYDYGFYGGQPISDLTLDDWAISDTGEAGVSIRTTAVSINGSYSNLVATGGSGGLLNQSTGSFVDGGGNVGL